MEAIYNRYASEFHRSSVDYRYHQNKHLLCTLQYGPFSMQDPLIGRAECKKSLNGLIQGEREGEIDRK